MKIMCWRSILLQMFYLFMPCAVHFIYIPIKTDNESNVAWGFVYSAGALLLL